ncbi:MAG TPA: radical SAM protein [Patescibacteria group bacterium]|nr:radical SAM protein [Patescibacteria group bacterium]
MPDTKSVKTSKTGTRLAIFRDLLLAKCTRRRIPLMANLLLTNRCNLKCFYCYVDTFHRTVEDLGTQKVIEVIDILHSHGTKIMVLLGGEPLVRNDLGVIIEHINRKRMICEVITNGFHVEKWLDPLRLADSVCVSLDGDQAANDRNRGPGSFQTAMEAIRILRENRIPTRIKAVITRYNIDALDFLADFVRDNRILMTSSVAVVYEARHYDAASPWLDGPQTRQFLEKLRALKRSGVPIGYSYQALDYCINWPHEYHAVIDAAPDADTRRYIKCLRKDFSLYMDADGTMYPCANLWGKAGKNILTDGFQAAWDQFRQYPCFCCGNIPDVDLSLLLGLSPTGILGAVRYFTGD